MTDATLDWFRREDHAGLGRRLLACLIDAAILVAILTAPGIIVSTMHLPTTTAPAAPIAGRGVLAVFGMFVTLIVATPYHLLFRRTRGGTIGYRLAGIHLIDMTGAIPSWPTLIRRLALSIIIPLIFWALLSAAMAAQGPARTTRTRPPSTTGQAIGGAILIAVVTALLLGNYWMVIRDPRRQALHDKWSRTWVVRSSARPAGKGRPIERAWILGPLVLGYWDVEPLEAARPAAATG